MKSGGRTLSASRERFGLRQALAAMQVALSLALLVGAFLFSGSLRNLLAVDAGFQQTGIVIADIDFSRLQVPSMQRVALKHDLLQRIRAIPGVASAGETAFLPLSGSGTENRVWKEGAPDKKIDSNFSWFGKDYLKTMGTQLLLGRDFNERDTLSSARVAIVNESFARKLGLGPNPIGAKLRREATPSEPERVFDVVGLVRDTKYYTLREKFLPIAFLSIDQNAAPGPSAEIVIRSTTTLTATTHAVRKSIAQVNAAMFTDFTSFETTVRDGLRRERLMATLSGFFGALAALISAVGLYGVMSFLVVRRTNEIGVRIALGAGRGRIVALILRQAGLLLAIGLAAGIGLTLAIAGAAKSILFGLEPYDAPTIAMAAALLAAVTAIASYLPARRAARLEPILALREE